MYTFLAIIALLVAGVDVTPLSNPCAPSPCGPNSNCRLLGDLAVCCCQDDFIGSPPNCTAECVINKDCAKDKACIRQKCKDPCPGVCGEKASCQVVNHNPICSCPAGFEGDPFFKCQQIPDFEVEATTSADPCRPSPCGPDSTCHVINGTAECKCLDSFSGSPPDCNLACEINSDCPNDRACNILKCVVPCPGPCGLNASCYGINHQPICSCPDGMEGDPFVICKVPAINVTNPCEPSPCFFNSECRVINNEAFCMCPPDSEHDDRCPIPLPLDTSSASSPSPDSVSKNGPVDSGNGPEGPGHCAEGPGHGPATPDRAACDTLSIADTFQLARSIKHCQALPLPTAERATFNHLKTTLSESVRNAVFLDEVCLVNKKFHEYLYSPASDFIYDRSSPQARRIFTWIPGVWNHHGKGDWKLIHHKHDEYYIVAVDNGEYMTASEEVVARRRKVTTTSVTPSWLVDNQPRALWTLEVAGDFMYIKNLHFKEFFYAVDGFNHDDERRTVATWSHDDNGCTGDQQCLWKIKSC